MINNNELLISNKSYVNKDFQKLYPEILELARQLSAKWDPSTSNESDPGVVLLKLLGFMGDKINYNIDKNILEAFMPSATQESSMRNLAEINGYYPRYYLSATTDISFMYTGTKLGANQSFTLKAFETTVTDVDNATTYTLLEDCIINGRYITTRVPAIEGKLESLTINDVSSIHLANLDDNNRLYFSERFVAENGVFIQRVNDVNVFWTKINNLNTNEPGQLVYKFGFDSIRNLPYLEFPTDISSIIGDGLTIKYIRTAGSSGNVRAGFLTRLSSPSEVFVDLNPSITVYPDTNENQTETTILTISNLSDSNNGEDPESINDIYNSFKKTVGTFDTLVTSRDYANAIYNLLTPDSKTVVSNVQVADRRTDINYSNQIISFNQYGPVKLNITDNDDITPFDLCLYPLNPITTSYNLTTYTNSFFPLTDLTDVNTGIDNYKTISHTFKSLFDSDIYLYKNYYKLNAKISTNFKVNTFEQSSILSNINDALFRNFNSRELDYGQEIPFDTLLNVVQGADTRIKNVSLEEPEIVTKVMTRNRAETFLLDPANKTPYLNLVTKNILAGRASLFTYNTDFDFVFGQTAVNLTTVGSSPAESDFLHEGLIKLTTEVTIPATSVKASLGYTLKDNEYIQAIAPSLATEVIYPAYVNYRWNGLNIPENQEHTISGTDSLIVNYVDSNNSSIAIEYTVNKINTYRVSKERESGEDYYTATIVSEVTVPSNIIKPVGLTLKTPQEYSISGIVTTKILRINSVNLDFYTLGTEESIEKRKFVETTLTSSSLPCYWLVSNENNALFTSGDAIYEDVGGTPTIVGYEKLLGENEYFMYSNSSLTELEVLGSGTRLTLKATSSEDLDGWKIVFSNTEEKVEIATVSERGLAAFENYNWRYKNFNTSTYNLKIEEMSILTLGTGDNIKISGGTSVFGDLTNDWVDVETDWTITYTIDGETKSLPNYTSTPWKVRSRLDLNSGPDLRQQILTNQVITLVLSNGSGGQKTRIFNNANANVNSFIVFNTLLQRAGGQDIDLKVTYLNGTSSYDVDAYTFNYTMPTYTELDGKIVNVEKQPSGYYQINCKNLVINASPNAEIDLPVVSYYDVGTRLSGDGKSQLMMIYWDHSAGTSTAVSLARTGTGGMRKYNSGNSYASTLALTPGINVIEMKSISELTIVVANPASGTDALQLTPISITSGYNPALNLDVADFEDSGGILEKIQDLDTDGLFFYNGSLDSYSLIEFDDVSDPRAMFDYNNLANRFTLPQIDFENSKIEIVRTSRV
jgi:hypothetical protein